MLSQVKNVFNAVNPIIDNCHLGIFYITHLLQYWGWFMALGLLHEFLFGKRVLNTVSSFWVNDNISPESCNHLG